MTITDEQGPVWKVTGPNSMATRGTSDIVSPRPPRKARAVRVEDELWAAALRKADERGDVLSEVIREALKRYVRSKP